jgi:hypothetical protein
MYQDEYFTIKQNAANFEFSPKQELMYNNSLRFVKDAKLKSGTLSKPFVKDLNNFSLNNFSLPIFSDEPVTNSRNVLLKDLNLFSNDLLIESSDELYESSKYINYLYLINYKSLLNGTFNGVQPISYSTIFDSFRSDYEDPYLYTDNLTTNNESFTNHPSSNVNNNLNLSNPFKLRSTVKNSIVTYSAIQKVFRSRFDEGRSNTRLEDFSNSYVKHPYITDPRIKYETLLGKNKESFLKLNFYNQNTKLNFSNMSSLFFSNNIYFMDLPFLVSMKSDPSRYLWFDWQSK